MGIYDYVNAPDIACPKCGVRVHGWQTKDGDVYLNTVEFSSVLNFYTSCPGCKAWIDFTRKPGAVLDDYQMTCEGEPAEPKVLPAGGRSG